MEVENAKPAILENEGNNEQKGTDSLPFVVKIKPSEKTDEERAEEANDRKRIAENERKKAKSDDDLVAYTGELAFFTKGLFAATVVMGIATIGLYVATKRSADIAERAITELEGPFLYPIMKLDNFKEEFRFYVLHDNSTSGDDAGCFPEVVFKIRNYGRTLALPKSVAVEFMHLSDMMANPRVDFLADYAVQAVIAPDTECEAPIKKTMANSIDRNAFNSIKESESRIFLYGEIRFSDIFGGDYIQTFCLAYNYSTKSFIPWGGKYNQRKRKSAKNA